MKTLLKTILFFTTLFTLGAVLHAQPVYKNLHSHPMVS